MTTTITPLLLYIYTLMGLPPTFYDARRVAMHLLFALMYLCGHVWPYKIAEVIAGDGRASKVTLIQFLASAIYVFCVSLSIFVYCWVFLCNVVYFWLVLCIFVYVCVCLCIVVYFLNMFVYVCVCFSELCWVCFCVFLYIFHMFVYFCVVLCTVV